ncbi:hypothetical protein QW131_11215 [Roseibium salinum]|nr:hypothetical protein [Roseibium salinum]
MIAFFFVLNLLTSGLSVLWFVWPSLPFAMLLLWHAVTGNREKAPLDGKAVSIEFTGPGPDTSLITLFTLLRVSSFASARYIAYTWTQRRGSGVFRSPVENAGTAGPTAKGALSCA